MSAAGLFSTRTEIGVWIAHVRLHRLFLRILDQIECGRARGDHREAVLLRIDPRVDHRCPASVENLAEDGLELLLRGDGEAGRTVCLREPA